LVRRSMAIMDSAGLISLPLKINGLEVKIVPVSPLAKAQNMDDVQDVLQWLQVASSLGPVGQATAKMDAISDYVADKLGVPMQLRTDDDERMEMENMMQEMMQQQMAAAPPEGGPVAGA